MRECWHGTGLSRPAAGEMVSKHRMQNVQFLAQTWPVEMPDNLKLGAHCELGSYVSFFEDDKFPFFNVLE